MHHINKCQTIKNLIIMKHFVFLAVLFLIGLGACQKEDMSPVDNQNMTVADNQSSSVNDSTSGSLDTLHLKAGTITGYTVSPRFGRPNSTYYTFKVYDVIGTLSLSVKLYDRATGTTTYLPMTKTGSYWLLSTKISNSGCFAYNYVYSISKNPINTSSYSDLWNSKNTFSYSGTSSISWPFGADGSSWYNRLDWIGANESGGCGSGPGEGGHYNQGCQADDSYAVDWNKNCSTPYADNGATVKSPLDGKVIRIMVNSSGYGNAIDIEQEASNGTKYVFRIAHLKYAPTLSVGTYIKAGVTIIGYVGMSGGTSTAPHAHCVLYNNNGSCKIGVPFTFNAQ